MTHSGRGDHQLILQFALLNFLLASNLHPLHQGEQVRATLGVGEVVAKPSEQDVADVIVIIGKDYKAPATNG